MLLTATLLTLAPAACPLILTAVHHIHKLSMRNCAGVESSQDALRLAHRNAELNGVSERVSFCKADVADYMREARGQGKTWDLIILDPPKLAPNKKVASHDCGLW